MATWMDSIARGWLMYELTHSSFQLGLCHVTSHALIQTVIQSYSPPEFRGRTMAIFHMTQVILVIGAMFIGGLAALLGARWARRGKSGKKFLHGALDAPRVRDTVELWL